MEPSGGKLCGTAGAAGKAENKKPGLPQNTDLEKCIIKWMKNFCMEEMNGKIFWNRRVSRRG